MKKVSSIPRRIRTVSAIMLSFVTTCPVAAPQATGQTDSSQQALQQLHLLQQRLANQQGQNTAQAGSNTSASASDAAATNMNNAGKNMPQNAATSQALVPGQGPEPVKSSAANLSDAEKDEAVAKSDEDLIAEKAFANVATQMFPLTPEQIIRLKQLYHTQEFAQAATAGVPPKPTATSQFVNLSPGSTPPVIRLSQGFVSSLVFLDSTGAPWPISAYDLGDPASFNIQWDKTGNTLMIQAVKLYNYGNLAVKLKGLNTPVMLTLIPGQKAVDYRVDLRVQGYGPNAAAMPTEEGIPPSASDILLHVLDGVPPAGSQRLTVSGGDARAWLVNDLMYVRTNLTILSPGWIGTMTSADGTHAYEMQKSPVLLVSWHGKVMQLKVEGL